MFGKWVTLGLAVGFSGLIAISTVAFVAEGLIWGSTSISPLRWLLVTFLPTALSFYGYCRRSLSLSGAISALLVGFSLTMANAGFFAALLVFFLTSSKATRYKQAQKKAMEGAAHREGGQRNWLQVLCNGGVPTQIALLYLLEVGCADLPMDFRAEYRASWLGSAVLGALACCNADTWASEIGSVASANPPRCIVTFRRVPRGTNGGVTLIGVAVSVLGGVAVGLGYYLGLWFTASAVSWQRSPNQLLLLVVGGASGLFGSLLDSLLGATMQYSGVHEESGAVVECPGPGVKHISGASILDNHGINLVSCVITAGVTPTLAQYIFS